MFSANFAFKKLITGTEELVSLFCVCAVLFLRDEFPRASSASATASAADSVSHKMMKWSPDNKSFLYRIGTHGVFFFLS
jgi:hypothetical protein